MPFCPRCAVEYRPSFTHCADCNTPLAAAPPTVVPDERRVVRTNAYLTLGLLISVTVGAAMGALTMCSLGLFFWRDWLAGSILLGIVYGGLPLGLVGCFVLGFLNVWVSSATRRSKILVALGVAAGALYGWGASSAVGTWLIVPASSLAGAVGGYLAEILFAGVAESWWRWWSR